MIETAFYDKDHVWYCPHCGQRHECIHPGPRMGMNGIWAKCACGRDVILKPDEHESGE